MPSVDDLWVDLSRRARDAERARGVKRYVARWRTADGKSRKRRFHDEAEAMRWALDHEGDTEGKRSAPVADISPDSLAVLLRKSHRAGRQAIERLRNDGQLSVSHGVEVYLFDKRNLAPRGLENALHHARWVRIDIGDRILTALVREDIEEWVAAMTSDAVAPSSIVKRRMVLRRMFTLCGVPDVSADVVVRGRSKPIETLTANEVGKLAMAMKYRATVVNASTVERPNARTLHALTLTLGLLGPRVQEALDLRVRDLLVDRKLLHVEGTKTVGSDRHIPVHESLMKVLLPLVEGRPGDAWLFSTADGQSQLTRSKVGHYIREASERVLGRRIRVHDLRHTAASLAIQDGDLAAASRLLGHRNVGITAAIYGHSNEVAVRAATSRSSVAAVEAATERTPDLRPPVDPSDPF